MKRVFITLMLVAGFLGFQSAHAQFSAGAGLAYGTDSGVNGDGAIGIQARAMYQFMENIRGSANFTFFLVDDPVNFSTLNVDGHYLFLNESFLVYALAGLNLAFVSVDLGAFGDASDSELGLNLGGGIQLPITDALGLLGEVKYVIGDADQLVLTVGAIFGF
ncbi:MAG: outer membrane beta-barrel protein [Saprospiraceae bacterium]|nr:outer membrane beta-barrel protein [Saprospiraceae bacterium]